MSKITKSLCTLTLLALSVFVLQGVIYAQEAKFQQMSGDTGLVCMEAENYSNIRESAVGTYWELVTDPEYYSGTGGLQALPAGENQHKDINNAQDYAPVLEYYVNFVKTDTLYVWGRSSHIDGYDDSVWFGLDTLIEGTLPLTYLTSEQSYSDVWYWINYLMGDVERAILPIPSTGVHVFELYMREPSFKIDKIVLTTDADYIPDEDDDMGPPETLVATGVESSEAVVPHELGLAQNYPNPFNPETTFSYSLPQSDFVTFTIYNLFGQEIAKLVNSAQAAGDHQIKWTAKGLPSGIYFYRLQSGNHSETKKLILQK
jgi:hypothetical protein